MTASLAFLLGLALATAPAAAELPFPCAKVQASQQVTASRARSLPHPDTAASFASRWREQV
jgi:hypothetical protein